MYIMNENISWFFEEEEDIAHSGRRSEGFRPSVKTRMDLGGEGFEGARGSLRE
jgi:hypothetical protein